MEVIDIIGIILVCVLFAISCVFLYWNLSVRDSEPQLQHRGPDWSEHCAVTPILCGLCESPDVTDSHIQDPGLLPMCLDCEEEVFNE